MAERVEPRLTAVFCPQELVGDDALDVGDGVVFDATNELLGKFNAEEIQVFGFNDYDSDHLADGLLERQRHDGPFEVDVDEVEFNDFFVANGVDDWTRITCEQMNAICHRYGVRPWSQL